MKLILRQTVDSLGTPGEIVDVAVTMRRWCSGAGMVILSAADSG